MALCPKCFIWLALIFSLFLDASKEYAWENHFAVKILSEELDLKHNCGYITMMNISTSWQNPKRVEFIKTSHENCVYSSTTVMSAESAVKESSIKENVIKESGAENQQSEKNRFSLNFPDSNLKYKNSLPFEENSWMPLDCSFGIPLFNGLLNKRVCQRLLEKQFCSKTK